MAKPEEPKSLRPLESLQTEWKHLAEQAARGEAFERFCQQFRSAIEGQKTRTVKLIGQRCNPRIYSTFLGYEIIARNKRVICPDMTTARYLRMFAEIGMKEVPIPYDVTRTQACLNDLEKAFEALQRIIQFFTDQIIGRPQQSKFLNKVHQSLRGALIKVVQAVAAES